MKLYCGNCGKSLHLTRKALKGLGIIVDIVDYHECFETPRAFDDAEKDVERFKPVEGKDAFIKELDNVKPSKTRPQVTTMTEKPRQGQERRSFPMQGTDDLRDRRFDQDKKPVTSTAPNSIAEQIRQMSNSIPANEVSDINTGARGENDSVEMGD